jgi:site-specific DNA-cytosine methylase
MALFGPGKKLVHETILRLTEQRGAKRFYAKGRYLERAGFAYETHLEISPGEGVLRIRVADEPTGKTVLQRKAGDHGYVPYIDLNRKALAEVFGEDCEVVRMHVAPGEIVVTVEPTEARIRARKNHFTHHSFHAGGGEAYRAARSAGYSTVRAVEFTLDDAARLQQIDPTAPLRVLPLQEALFRPAPQVGLMTCHLPGSPASDHPLADLAAFAFAEILKCNAHTVLITAEPDMASGETAEALRRALLRAGYAAELAMIEEEGQRRAVIAAITPDAPDDAVSVAPWIARLREAMRAAAMPAAAALALAATPLAVEADTRFQHRVAERPADGRASSVFSGAGLGDYAAQLAGFSGAHAVEYEWHFAEAFGVNHPGTAVHQMSVHEAQFSPHIEPAELLSMGIPCTPFSPLSTTVGGQKRPKGAPRTWHPQGDMTFWAFTISLKMNPRTIVIENVPDFGREMGVLLEKAYARLCYLAQSSVLDSAQFGLNQSRPRFVSVYMTPAEDGSVPSPWPAPAPPPYASIADLLDEAPPELAMDVLPKAQRNEWWDPTNQPNRFGRAVDHQAKGRNFGKWATVRLEDTCTPTLGAEHGNANLTQPVLVHPTRPDCFRWFSVSEGRRLFGLPEDYYLGDGWTRPWEMLGQGVAVPMFRQVFELATGRTTALQQVEQAWAHHLAPLVEGQLDLFG